MSRRKRDYEEEVIGLIKRFEKYPEAKRSARNERNWYEFLDSIGIKPQAHKSQEGKAFWDSMRNNYTGYKPKIQPSQRQIKEQNVTKVIELVFRDNRGRFCEESNLESRVYEIIRYYDNETNRQIARETVIRGRM